MFKGSVCGLPLAILAHVACLGCCFVFDFLPSNLTSPPASTSLKNLVLIGGALKENNSEIYDTIIRLAGGRGVAKIGIIVAASLEPQATYQYYSNIFMNTYGALHTSLIPLDVNHTHRNSDPKVVQLIKEQTGFFFGGGYPRYVVQSFFNEPHLASPALDALKSKYEQGTVMAGTSAGMECLPTALMLRDGVAYDALLHGSHDHVVNNHPDDLVYYYPGGLGLLDGFLLDAHFSQKGREGRLIRLLMDTHLMTNGAERGIGVDENTALWVQHVGSRQAKGTVLGENGVTIIDVSRAIKLRCLYFGAQHIHFHYLTRGDAINMTSLDVTFAKDKTPLRGREMYDHALTSKDIFSGTKLLKSEFVRVATSVFDARLDPRSYGVTSETPMFRVDVSRAGEAAVGFVRRGDSFDQDMISYMYTNLHVEVKHEGC